MIIHLRKEPLCNSFGFQTTATKNYPPFWGKANTLFSININANRYIFLTEWTHKYHYRHTYAMGKYTFTIRTSFIPPKGRLPRFKDLPQDVQKEYAGKAEAEDIFFLDTAEQPLLPVKGFKTTAKAIAEDGCSAKSLVYGTAEDEWIEIESEDIERYGSLHLRFKDVKAVYGYEEELTGIEVLQDGIWKKLQADALLDEELYRLYVKLYGSSAPKEDKVRHSVLVGALMAMCRSLRYGEADTLAFTALNVVKNNMDDNAYYPDTYFVENANGWGAFPVPLASSTDHREPHLAIGRKDILNTEKGRVLLSESIPLGLAVVSGKFSRGDEVEDRGYAVFGCV